jgi:Alginate export
MRFISWVSVAIFWFASCGFGQQPSDTSERSSSQQMAALNDSPAPQSSQAERSSQAASGNPEKHKIGPFEISINWRTRTEGWQWFQGTKGDNEYPFFDSLLRISIGQTRENLDWFIEGEQVSILGVPNDAVVGAPQGQLGLGGTYFVANGNQVNNSSGFVKQAYVNFKRLGNSSVKLGRFEFFDGLEVKPQDPTLGTIVQTRIAHRLISNFTFAAVQRTFDGGQYSWNSASNNFTFFGARPTQGVFQVDGMDELNVEVYYGAFNHAVETSHGPGALRVFALGYVDDRNNVLKTDNRPVAARTADVGKVEIATYGANYVQVLNTERSGKFDFLVWGALQGGSWGALTQRAGSLVGEVGWQPAVALKPWISAGYSYGSGDGNPKDGTNGTFFQVLTTPRQYSRFPFYNMINNEDAYLTLNVQPASKVKFRSEAHALRLANSHDLWYLGGGAFQPSTFGYTGRPSDGHRGLANVWDLSVDYQITRNLTLTPYYAHAWGKAVIQALYPRNANGSLAFLETNFHF